MAQNQKNRPKRSGSGVFGYDGAFYVYTSKIFDMLLLNFLWLVGCLPVITAGASFSALYFVTLHSVREDGKGVFREFWRVWKRDLKQSVPIWLAALALFFTLLLNLGFLREQEPGMLWLFFIVFFVFILFWAIVYCCYLFPAICTFNMPLKWILKLAGYLEFRHLPLSLLLGILFVTIWFSMLSFPWLILVLPSVFALFSSFILEPVFVKHMPEQ